MQSANLNFEFSTTFFLPWPVAYCSTKLITLCLYLCEIELLRRMAMKKKLRIFFIVILCLWNTYGMAFFMFTNYFNQVVGTLSMYSSACKKRINLLDLINFTILFSVSIFCSTTWIIALFFIIASSPCIIAMLFFIKSEEIKSERSQIVMVYRLWAKQHSKQKLLSEN